MSTREYLTTRESAMDGIKRPKKSINVREKAHLRSFVYGFGIVMKRHEQT